MKNVAILTLTLFSVSACISESSSYYGNVFYGQNSNFPYMHIHTQVMDMTL